MSRQDVLNDDEIHRPIDKDIQQPITDIMNRICLSYLIPDYKNYSIFIEKCTHRSKLAQLESITPAKSQDRGGITKRP